jgi:hypothetical protein
MNYGDFAYYGNLRAAIFVAGIAVECVTDLPVSAAASIAENFIKTASTQCLTNLEALWSGRDDPSAAAQQAAAEADARNTLCGLIRDIFGQPFHTVNIDPGWLTSHVVSLARAMYEDRVFDRLPMLGDALEKARCTNPDILAHCRGPGPHVRGCWVVDLLLGKN